MKCRFNGEDEGVVEMVVGFVAVMRGRVSQGNVHRKRAVVM